MPPQPQPTSDLRPSIPANGNEVLVRVQGVSKKFCRDLKKSLWYGVKDVAGELNPFARKAGSGGRQDGLRDGEFWANKDISFELRRGECLGLIGRNGAGKTTLLKMLNGLIKPDAGSIEMRGRVGALIALGAGFNPILTGRENIYVNGSILGLSKKEIDEKIEDIINFAEIREFIDAPVQSYSSGMQVRLGFSVATALDPDVLILDEVLAVGDAAFRNKCYQRISKIQKNSAVIFVSHSMQQIAKICDKVLALSKGSVAYCGGSKEGIDCYESLNADPELEDESFSTFEAPLTGVEMSVPANRIAWGGKFELEIQYQSDEEVNDFCVRFMFFNAQGGFAADSTFVPGDYGLKIRKGGGKWKLDIPVLPLKNGKYKLGISLLGKNGHIMAWNYKKLEMQIHGGDLLALADCCLPSGKWEEVG